MTEESRRRDTEEKPALYDAMGGAEYVIFAPQRGDGGPALFGYRRDPRDGWVPWQADMEGRLRSEVLEGLRLYPGGNRLRLLDPAGMPLPTEEELLQREIAACQSEARARAEAERQSEIDLRARVAAERDATEAHAEVRRLRALLGNALEQS